MPTKIKIWRETGAVIFEHTCDDCGSNAEFGEDAFLRKAFNAIDKKQPEKAKELLGKCYCYQCLRSRHGIKPA